MNDYKTYELGDVCSRLSSGKSISASEVAPKGIYPVFGGNGLRGFTEQYNFSGDCAIIGRQGAFCGNVRYYSGKAYMTEHAVVVCATPDHNTRYLSYLLSRMNLGRLSGQSAQPGLSVKILAKQQVTLPSLEIQNRITSILSKFDEKIELNKMINDNLEKQVMALYQQMFVETINTNRKECRADEFFDISIGKTPPRKEPQWFSCDNKDITWVSISDMGSCGTYISTSSERLTLDAVKKHNVKIVPDNTVLLSFKLTVGRVAITDGEMTTNEAIAHFKTKDSAINEYLYCYLKKFNYQTMGSTSSIAVAVNSKIIKGMLFIVPTDSEIAEFHKLASPMFAMIKANIKETHRLVNIRDTILPKLVTGKIDVSGI